MAGPVDGWTVVSAAWWWSLFRQALAGEGAYIEAAVWHVSPR